MIAPLFFYTLGGVSAMMVYNLANTLDSMIGCKSGKYREFGWFAARFDDEINFIPARITALLIVVLSFCWCGLAFIFRYGHHTAA